MSGKTLYKALLSIFRQGHKDHTYLHLKTQSEAIWFINMVSGLFILMALSMT